LEFSGGLVDGFHFTRAGSLRFQDLRASDARFHENGKEAIEKTLTENVLTAGAAISAGRAAQ